MMGIVIFRLAVLRAPGVPGRGLPPLDRRDDRLQRDRGREGRLHGERSPPQGHLRMLRQQE